jgi:hypothetical protein
MVLQILVLIVDIGTMEEVGYKSIFKFINKKINILFSLINYSSQFFFIYNKGYGRGAYFANDPNYSNGFTNLDHQNCRCIFIAKVLLGKQMNMTNESRDRTSCDPGYHSVFGPKGYLNFYFKYFALKHICISQ